MGARDRLRTVSSTERAISVSSFAIGTSGVAAGAQQLWEGEQATLFKVAVARRQQVLRKFPRALFGHMFTMLSWGTWFSKRIAVREIDSYADDDGAGSRRVRDAGERNSSNTRSDDTQRGNVHDGIEKDTRAATYARWWNG